MPESAIPAGGLGLGTAQFGWDYDISNLDRQVSPEEEVDNVVAAL